MGQYIFNIGMNERRLPSAHRTDISASNCEKIERGRHQMSIAAVTQVVVPSIFILFLHNSGAQFDRIIFGLKNRNKLGLKLSWHQNGISILSCKPKIGAKFFLLNCTPGLWCFNLQLNKYRQTVFELHIQVLFDSVWLSKNCPIIMHGLWIFLYREVHWHSPRCEQIWLAVVDDCSRITWPPCTQFLSLQHHC